MQKTKGLNLKVQKNKPVDGADKSILHAAALQDHLKKQFVLDVPNFKPKQSQSSHLPYRAPLKITKRRIINAIDRKFTNDATASHSMNDLDKNLPFLKAYEKKEKIYEESEKNKHEKKLDDYNKGLSLAQKLGLVEKPPQPMTYEEWKDIETKIEKREDDCENCPICLEGFRVPNSQVILSCSHTFHKACLSSFERHSRTRACPICRRKDYEKKSFDKGFSNYMKKSVIKIQKWARGYIIRRWFYEDLINKGYKGKSTLFKRRLIGYKLGKLSKRWDDSQRKKKKETDDVFKEISKNAEIGNNLIEAITNLEAVRRQNKETLNEITPQIMALASNDKAVLVKKTVGVPEIEWNTIVQKAKDRCDKDCPICYMKFGGNKKLTLLDCSHVFHAACLNAFEFYDPYKAHTCPVCRHKYRRADIENID